MKDYTAKLRDPDETLKMLKRHSLACPDGSKDGIQFNTVGGEYADLRHGTVGADRLIRYVKLFKAIDHTAYRSGLENAQSRVVGDDISTQSNEEQQRRMGLAAIAEQEFNAEFKWHKLGAQTLVAENATVAAPDRAPCYFLPWDPDGAAVELTIPALADDATLDSHPPVFMTAALSGCSIFVTGTTRNPKIFHCGSMGETRGRDAKTFWTNVMREIAEDDEEFAQFAIHNRDYMIAGRGSQGTGKRMVKDANSQLSQYYKGSLKIEQTSSWGAVFGVRRGENWEFYLQENVSVLYKKVTPPTGFFKKIKRPVPVGESRKVTRPVMVRKIFPDGGGAAQLINRWRTLRF